MSNQNQKNEGISDNIKETAGAAFHTAHKALEATENMAMNAVDATTKAVSNLTDNDTDSRNNR